MSVPESPMQHPGDVLLREVHVWTAAVEAPGQRPERLLACLSGDELARHRRLLREGDRTLFLLARALLRHALSRYAPVAPQDWRFEAGAYGRPELAPRFAHLELRFNVSHANGLAACAVTRGMAVGVDVESHHRPVDPLRVARHTFTPEEQATLEELTESARLERFLQLWTLKEAYAKARGLGLRLPLKAVHFDLGAKGPRVRFLPPVVDDPGSWQLFRWQPARGFQGALALHHQGLGPRKVHFPGDPPFR